MSEHTNLGNTMTEAFTGFDAIGEKAVTFGKQAATQFADVLDAAVGTTFEFQRELAKSSGLEWLSSVTESGQKLAKTFTTAASDTARTMLR